jgi:putative ABC transport system ATP-binding protein
VLYSEKIAMNTIMKNDNIIELKDVCKTYKMGETEIKAVCDANLQIKRGDFLAIIGPSGSGKSTMMNMVGALDLSTSGDIFLDGQNIEHLEESELAQIRGRKIGFVFQTFNLIPTLNAIENIALPMVFHGIGKEERMQRAEEILKQVGLTHRRTHFPKQLSGGERQRVAVGRALANDPEVILADEPTGNLDTKTGLEIMKLFEELNKKGKTIILVTHNLDLIQYVQKVLKISDGKIIEHRKVKQHEIK